MLLHHKFAGGRGDPLVILHGLFGSLDNWAGLGKRFADHYSVYLLDQRNHGRSPWSETWSYDAMAHDLDVWLQHMGLEETHVLGHSMGGKTAMQFAHYFPEKVKKLMVADIAPRTYPPHHEYILKGLQAVNLKTLSSRQEADQALAGYISDRETRQLLLKGLARQEAGFAWRFHLEVIVQKYDAVLQPPAMHIPFPKPSLFLYGLKSNFVRPEDQAEILHWFPEARFAGIEQAGHWLHAEQPDAFLEAALAFLA